MLNKLQYITLRIEIMGIWPIYAQQACAVYRWTNGLKNQIIPSTFTVVRYVTDGLGQSTVHFYAVNWASPNINGICCQ